MGHAWMCQEQVILTKWVTVQEGEKKRKTTKTPSATLKELQASEVKSERLGMQ